MCRRAAASGLPLCMNYVQNLAQAHAQRMSVKERADAAEFIADTMTDLFEAWLSVEHHDTYERLVSERAKAETLPGTYVGDDMEEVIQTMLASDF